MFSLIRFHNQKFSILNSKNVEKKLRNTCVVKYNGGKYSAFVIAQNDNKSYLVDLKRVKEQKCSSFSKNSETICTQSTSSPTSSQSVLQNRQRNLNKHLILKNIGDYKDHNTRLRPNLSKNISVVSTRNKANKNSRKSSITTDIKKSNITESNVMKTINIGKKYDQDKKSIELTQKDQIHLKKIYPSISDESDEIKITEIFSDKNNKEQTLDDQIHLKETLSISDATNSTEIFSNKTDILPQIQQSSTNITDNISYCNPSALFLSGNTCSAESTIDNLNDYDEKSNIPKMPIPLISHHNSTTVSTNSSKTENFMELSSINIDDSTISEYIPDSTAGTNNEDLANSKTIEEKHENINFPINVNKVIVPYSKTKAKKYFCVYCKTLQCKIGRHLFLKHKDQKDVKLASTMPKKSRERLKIIDKLRKQGDFMHNTSENLNSGVLIVSRQQQTKCNNIVDNYVCCRMCKGFYSKKTLRIHLLKCGTSKNKRSNLIESRRLTQFIHSAANNVLKTKIFPVLRDDEIARSIRYDELIIKYGNKMAEKYSSEHQHDMIRANLRLLGRFIIELKKTEPEINELKEIFKPRLFDKCVNALRIVANWDESVMWFNTPAVAQNLTSLIKKCGKKQRTELIKENREDLKEELENFLLLWEEEIPTLINKKACEDQNNQKRIKKVVLPSKEDIKKLYLYLKEKMINAMENLSHTFCNISWTELVQVTLIFIQIFNRRRAGEIERLTTENFANKEVITDTMDNDILKSVSNDSIKFAKQFVRITLRGKLGRTVSVLLCPISVKAIDIILKYRSDAGIATENKYIFSKPTNSDLTKMYYRACPLLKRFSEECGARIPESLRGTTLRKHIATYTSLLNVEEASVDRLANFMGHLKDIHKGIYRMSVPVAEITCVSKLLMGAVGDEVEEEQLEEDVDIEEYETDENILPEKQNLSTSSTIKRRSTSPFGKTKRSRWSTSEKEAVYSIFGDLEKLEKLPSLDACLSAIRQSTALKNRTPQQLKSWIDNQRR